MSTLRLTRSADLKFAGIVFIASGIGFAIVTLVVAGWSTSFFVGLIAGAILLGIGARFGLRRLPRSSEASNSHEQSLTPQIESRVSAKGVGLAVAGAGAAAVLTLGFAYLVQELGHEAKLGVELGIVSLVITAFCFAYAGLLQLALASRS